MTCWHTILPITLTAALCGAVGAASPPMAPAKVQARIGQHHYGNVLVTGGTLSVLGFTVVPGSGGREILLEMGPATGCIAETERFWRTYERLAAAIPRLRIRYDPATEHLRALNGREVLRARARTDKAAAELIGECDYKHDREREEARARFEKNRREGFLLNDGRWFLELSPLFLGLLATNGLTDWTPKRTEGPCGDLVGARLTSRHFKGFTRCKVVVRRAGESDEPEDLGTYRIEARNTSSPENLKTLYVVYSKPAACDEQGDCADEDPNEDADAGSAAGALPTLAKSDERARTR